MLASMQVACSIFSGLIFRNTKNKIVMAKFTGKNILVVGASSGIGNQIAKNVIEQGGTVFSASRNKPGQLDVRHMPLDVLNMSGDELNELPEALHGLVYCPGTINLKPFQRLSKEDFQQDFNINTLGAVQVVQAVLNRLKKAEHSSLVFFSTVAFTVGMNFHASIAAAKGALEGVARSLAAEYSASGVRVNIVAPSLTDTPLATKLLSSDTKREATAKRHPIPRVGTIADMSSAATFLLSDDAAWITGQKIGVDGGMSNLRTI